MAIGPENALIVQSDCSVLLDVHAPRAAEARAALAPFAELVKSPEHIHTYRLTPLSIWNACASGLAAGQMVAALNEHARYAVPRNVEPEIVELAARYGRVVITRDGDWLLCACSDDATAERLSRDREAGQYLAARIDATRFRVDPGQRGVLKQALTAAGFPAEDLTGYASGEPFPIALRESAGFVLRDYRIEETGGRLLDLLDTWQQAAKALHREETSVAVRLQSDLLKSWKNWNKALAAFRRVPEPRFSSLRERLFAQWRELIAKKSLGDFFYVTGVTSKFDWVQALADAAWEGEDSGDSLCASLRRWLQILEKDDATLRRSRGALSLLCLDLDSSSWLSPISPTLGRLLACCGGGEQALRMSRRKWLERLGVSSLTAELLAFWKECPSYGA